jgi:SanA protein
MRFLLRRWRSFVAVLLAVLVLAPAALIVCDELVVRAAAGRCHARAEDVPYNKVGLVLGCSRTAPSGQPNRLYRNRIAAAAALFHAGRVSYLIASGDNGRADYDEPTAMKEDLVAAGVPAERIYRDCAGFRTLDSIARAKMIFGLEDLTIVSQRFHNERALYLARAHGIDAVALDADAIDNAAVMQKNLARERIARGAAVLDVLCGRGPRFRGPPIRVGETAAN